VKNENIVTLVAPLGAAILLALGALALGGEVAFDKVLPIATLLVGGGLGAKARGIAKPPPR